MLRMNGLLSPVGGDGESQRGQPPQVVPSLRPRKGSERALTLSRDHVGNLDHRIDLRFGEDTFATSALDIEGKDPKRSDSRPVTFRRVRDQVIVSAVRTFGSVPA